jgi:hypothetical protein
MVREQLARFRGREIKTLGDDFLATFDGPARAVRCACSIVESLYSLGIDVRVGLHTGEVELKDDDVGGIAVNPPALPALQDRDRPRCQARLGTSLRDRGCALKIEVLTLSRVLARRTASLCRTRLSAVVSKSEDSLRERRP